jgi:hypothetical protein
MGWTETVYDCYVNHYEGYKWKDLEKLTDAVPYFEELGWNSSTWDGDIDYTPETENMDWGELSDEQQNAALALCFFEELWSKIEIPSWTEFLHVDMCAVSNDTIALNISTVNASDAELELGEEMLETPIDVDGSEIADEMEEPANEDAVIASAGADDGKENGKDKPNGQEADALVSSSASGSAGSPLTIQVITTGAPTEPTEIDVKYVPNPSNRFLLWSWMFEKSKEAATTLGEHHGVALVNTC